MGAHLKDTFRQRVTGVESSRPSSVDPEDPLVPSPTRDRTTLSLHRGRPPRKSRKVGVGHSRGLPVRDTTVFDPCVYSVGARDERTQRVRPPSGS